MSLYRAGDIVLVNFPFTDLQTSKVRPALVIGMKGEDAIIVGIFSRVPESVRDSWVVVEENLPYFPNTGLKKRSVIKTEKIAVVHQSVIRKRLGRLPSEAMKLVRAVLRKTLELEE